MSKTKISAEIVADSICNGRRITTMKLVYPRFIHSEMCRHRAHSRNTASSRAIPTTKMIEAVMNDPVIPIAWQKQHPGMQGTEYITDPTEIAHEVDCWLRDRQYAVREAQDRLRRGITKQIVNRPLEAWMWTVELVTATEWENFFELRCPRYRFIDEIKGRSRKDILKQVKKLYEETGVDERVYQEVAGEDDLFWLSINDGQAEIHMMALAEAMWDARNESTPKELKPGEWHIPFGDQLDLHTMRGFGDEVGPANMKMWLDASGHNEKIASYEVQIATARAARVSYTVVGEITPGTKHISEKLQYQKDIELHDRLAASGHWSPFEHCARAMTHEEYHRLYIHTEPGMNQISGWCKNFRGWIQYRAMFPGENKTL